MENEVMRLGTGEGGGGEGGGGSGRGRLLQSYRKNGEEERGGEKGGFLKNIVLIPTYPLQVPTNPPFFKVLAHRPGCLPL